MLLMLGLLCGANEILVRATRLILVCRKALQKRTEQFDVLAVFWNDYMVQDSPSTRAWREDLDYTESGCQFTEDWKLFYL
jgi:hypothetical protein